jgi:hypothetical protein
MRIGRMPFGKGSKYESKMSTPMQPKVKAPVAKSSGYESKMSTPMQPKVKAPKMMAMGGMAQKMGYAKGGMIKANCGASMKPTQKGKK